MFNEFPSNSATNHRHVSQYVDCYESALAQSPTEEIDCYLPPEDAPFFLAVLSELARIRIEWDWRQGNDLGLEKLLSKFPQISDNQTVLAEVAFEDYRQRALSGRPSSHQRYREMYQLDTSNWPTNCESEGRHWACWELGDGESHHMGEEETSSQADSSQPEPAGIESTLGNNHKRLGSTDPMNGVVAIEDGQANLPFPSAGDRFGGFQIIRELGCGTFSRVYLARQSDLAQRYVVLKVTATPMGESQRLARLQHANIMPLYSVHRIEGLFGLCMPFLGATTLKELLQEVKGSAQTPQLPASGKVIARVIQNSATDSAGIPGQRDGSGGREQNWLIGRYQNQTYVDAVLTIVWRLAEGLAHAHQRGVFHHDIKPANVLLAFDGEPLLMDFNLGRDARNQQGSGRRIVGGTLPYMAPEHLRAMQYASEELTPASDIFSLGVLLHELLTGRVPFKSDDPNRMDLETVIAQRRLPVKFPSEYNPAVSPGVVAIVQKCLHPSAAERYSKPEELAIDLRLHLNHYPNRFASNPSINERLRKFSRRHPILISGTSMFLLVAFIVGTLAYWFVHARNEKTALQAAQTYGQFQEALHLAEAELLFPEGGSYQLGLQRAEHALAIYSASLTDIKTRKNTKWEQSPMVRMLPEEDRRNLKQQISQLNALAESARAADGLEPGASESQYGEYEGVDGETSIEPFRKAVELYHAREYESALQILETELERTPSRFVLWFVQGNCYFQMGKYRQAEHAYAMASWIDRSSALCHIKRAVCYYQLFQSEAALEHFAKAEDIAPGIAAIYSNRCLLFERRRSFDEALVEINRAIELQPNSARFLMMRSRIYRSLNRTTEAQADLSGIQGLTPDNPDDWITKGIAILADSPVEAIACFRRACVWPGGIITGRQNTAHVLSERLGRTEEAIGELDELLSIHPRFLTALSGRGVLHARLGNAELALRDVQRCLELEPAPETYYQIACIYSLLSVQDPTMMQPALKYLAMAIQPAYPHQMVTTDDDLRPLEGNEEFEKLKSGLQTVQQLSSPTNPFHSMAK